MYETLHLNLKNIMRIMPSPYTIRKSVIDHQGFQEGLLRFSELIEYLTEHNYPLKYSPKNNQLVGFTPPLEENGFPMLNRFPSDSLKQIQHYFDDYSKSNYIKNEPNNSGYREHLREFIECYRDEPCLWQTKSKYYHDRNRKNAAYNRLLEKYRPIDPSATRAVVVKKINNLRTAYKKELDKWKGSQKSGAGTDEIRTPTLWYFHLLDFLYEQEIPRSSISNISDDDSEDHSTEILESPQQCSNTQSQSSSQSSQQFQNKQSDDERDVSTPSSTPVRFRPTKKTNTLTDEVLRTLSDHFKRPKTEDRFDVFGKIPHTYQQCNISISLNHLKIQLGPI
ncbi:hypothetical protein FQR65_LT14062 [Abscondita terminalis]|nr:hypothetical protein FQR65_LT14062 [Abscondita terminalis]